MIYPMDFSISSIRFPTFSKEITHLIHSTDDVAGHFIESVLHLLEHVLDEGVELFSWGVFRAFWVVVHFIVDEYLNISDIIY